MDVITMACLAGVFALWATVIELCRSGRSPVPRKSDWCDEPGLAQVTRFVSAKEAKH